MTFATRLLLGGFALSLVIITAVSAFLLVSRNQQTDTGAQTNAESRAQAFRELVQQVAAPQARFAASAAAGLPEMAPALASVTPRSSAAALLSGPTKVVTDLPDEEVAIFDTEGSELAATGGSGLPPLPAGLPEVRAALGGSPAESIDLLRTGLPVYDFAAPVRSSNGETLGAVVYSMPLPSQLMRLVGALGQGYTPLLVANRRGATLEAISGSADQPASGPANLPADLSSQLGGSSASLSGFTTMPGAGAAAIALEGVNPNPGPPVLYVGVETPLSLFVGDQTTDELTVVWLALTALLLTWLLVLLFVNRFVRRPVAQLSEGVARIAGGDYASDIPIQSRDELGVLAEQVNRMRAQIQSNVHHIDSAVARLDEVSRALTTTTAGVPGLESAVCAAAASISGPGARAWVLGREDDDLAVRARSRPADPDPELPDHVVAGLLHGRTTRFHLGEREAGGWSLAIPMRYRDEVAGAIAVSTPERLSDADIRALSALANNAAIAVANTQLFERERETVRRLLELDEMKSDFLATAQHELRTPLTAIVGHVELLQMLWGQADDTQKLAIVGNIELASHQLSDLVETMIDLSLVSADNLRMQRRDVNLADAVEEAAHDVARHHPGGLPVELRVDVPAELCVDADPERLRQVFRCLIDNAVKFTPPGGRVAVSARPGDGPDRCLIEVEDNGIGIDPSLHERVFDRFFQVESGGTRTYGGMGVGLALVKVLVEAHGGDVRLSGELGMGTTVRVEWPTGHGLDQLASADEHVDLTASRQSQVAS
ncbi:MAG TPA: ATP-binding protein [Candidatus Binatia bacterium]|nr:ATP-binding protein [Candidatus Binatia bacterium]